MRLFEFAELFPDEHSCKMDMKEKRERVGMACKRCNSTDLRWHQPKYQWHCRDCSFRTTLRSGTGMQSSNVPVHIWYQCMALMSATKKPISAHEMQRNLAMKRYEPVWAMMHKIRSSMGQRDERYSLKGIVEFDEAHFKKHVSKGVRLKK